MITESVLINTAKLMGQCRSVRTRRTRTRGCSVPTRQQPRVEGLPWASLCSSPCDSIGHLSNVSEPNTAKATSNGSTSVIRSRAGSGGRDGRATHLLDGDDGLYSDVWRRAGASIDVYRAAVNGDRQVAQRRQQRGSYCGAGAPRPPADPARGKRSPGRPLPYCGVEPRSPHVAVVGLPVPRPGWRRGSYCGSGAP